MPSSVPSTVAPWLYVPFFGLIFWLAAAALGLRLQRILKAPLGELSAWERGLVCAAIGAGVLQIIPLALASCGQLHPGPTRLAFALVVAALAADMYRVGRAAWRGLVGLRSAPWTAPLLVWLSIWSVLLTILLVKALAIGAYGDDDGYHLSAPKRWLEAGTLIYLPTFTHTNASLGFEMLYELVLSTWGPVATKIVHYGAGVLSLLGVFLVGLRLSGPLCAAAAVSMLLIATPVSDMGLLFGLAYVDLGVCMATAATLLLWLQWQSQQRPIWLTNMAICAGFAGSFKFTALAVGLAWLPSIAYEARRKGVSWLDTTWLAARFGAIAAIPVAPWLFRNWKLTGNALYPMLSTLIPTRDWSAQHAEVFGRYIRYYAWGLAAGANLSQARRMELVAVAALLVTATAALAWRWLQRSELRGLVAFAAVFMLVSLALTGLLVRYWLPALLAIFTLLGVAYATFTQRHKAWAYLPALLALLAIATRVQREPHLASDFRLATGLGTPDEEFADNDGWQMWKYINSHTPQDARVVIAAFYTTFGASSFGGFWVDRMCFATDSHLQDSIRLADWDSFLESLEENQIHYMVIADGQFAPNRHGFSFVAGQNEYPFCRRLVDQYGLKIVQIGHLQLYSFNPRAVLSQSHDG